MEQQMEMWQLLQLQKKVWQIAYPIIFTLGVFGNIAIVIVINLKSCRIRTGQNMPSSTVRNFHFYLTVLAVFDSLVIVTTGLEYLEKVYSTVIENTSDVACKLLVTVTKWSMDVASFLVCLLSIDRAVHIIYPVKCLNVCTIRTSRIAALAVSLLLLAVNGHIVFKIKLIGRLVTKRTADGNQTINTSQYRYRCGIDIDSDPDYEKFHADVFPWLNSALYCLIPFCIICTSNAIIIRHLLRPRSRLIRKVHEAHQIHYLKTVYALGLISVIFLVSTATVTIALIALQLGRPYKWGVMADQVLLTRRVTAVSLGKLFCLIQHSTNFIVYGISLRWFKGRLRSLKMTWDRNITERMVRTFSGGECEVCHPELAARRKLKQQQQLERCRGGTARQSQSSISGTPLLTVPKNGHTGLKRQSSHAMAILTENTANGRHSPEIEGSPKQTSLKRASYSVGVELQRYRGSLNESQHAKQHSRFCRRNPQNSSSRYKRSNSRRSTAGSFV